MNETTQKCLYCGRDADMVPLVALRHRGAEAWICPQHLPILIHKPWEVADKLPGALNLGEPEGHD